MSAKQILLEYAKQITPEYPNLDECDEWELMYAIKSCYEGTMAANHDLHGIIEYLRKKLDYSVMDVINIGKSIYNEEEPETPKKTQKLFKVVCLTKPDFPYPGEKEVLWFDDESDAKKEAASRKSLFNEVEIIKYHIIED